MFDKKCSQCGAFVVKPGEKKRGKTCYLGAVCSACGKHICGPCMTTLVLDKGRLPTQCIECGGRMTDMR
jgi:hypothetical protein